MTLQTGKESLCLRARNLVEKKLLRTIRRSLPSMGGLFLSTIIGSTLVNEIFPLMNPFKWIYSTWLGFIHVWNSSVFGQWLVSFLLVLCSSRQSLRHAAPSVPIPFYLKTGLFQVSHVSALS